MANDTIGSLVAVVKATADQFAADMKKVQGTLDEIKVHAEKSGAGVKSAFEIGASVELFKRGFEIASQAVESFFKLFEGAEQLHAMSEELGITAQQLDEFHFAAMEVGQSAEVMDATLGKLTQKIGEAREGSEKTSVAFAALGLNVNKLAHESAADSFREIADAMQQVKSHSDRAAIAVELFGKQGRALLPILEGGSEHIDELVKRGHDLNEIVSDEQVEAMRKAGVALKELEGRFHHLAIEMAADVAPAFSWLGKKIDEARDKAVSFGDWVGNKLVPLQENVSQISDFQRNRSLADTLHRALPSIKPKGEGEGDEDENIIARHKRLAKEAEEAAKQAKKRAEELSREVRQRAEEIAREAARITQSVQTPFEKFNETLRKLDSLLMEGALSWDTFTRASTAAGEELAKALRKNKELESSMRGGIAAADISTSAGASLAISAQSAAQDIAMNKSAIEDQQLEEQRITNAILLRLEQNAIQQAGRNIALAVADF